MSKNSLPEHIVEREVKALGNGAMVPIHRADLAQLGAGVGSTVRISMQVVDDNYAATRRAARAMRHRFSRTLQLLGA